MNWRPRQFSTTTSLVKIVNTLLIGLWSQTYAMYDDDIVTRHMKQGLLTLPVIATTACLLSTVLKYSQKLPWLPVCV